MSAIENLERLLADRHRESTEPVGLLEIAERLGVKAQTARHWQFRGNLPPAPFKVSGQPCWTWGEIFAWAEKTGRLK